MNLRVIAVALAFLVLGGCGSLTSRDSGPSRPVDVSGVREPVPRSEPRSKYGNPASYVVGGRRYYVMDSAKGYVERGTASWYGKKFHGKRTSSGETYNMYAMTAAHKTLPIPTYARITNLDNGRAVTVKINDRGPFHADRLIDLSYAAASKLGIAQKGTGRVEVRVIDTEQPLSRQTVARPAGESNPPPVTGAPALPELIVQKIPDAASRYRPGITKIYLQLGAFVSRANAEQLLSKVHETKLATAAIDTVGGTPNPVYRVRIGPMPSVEDADTLAARLALLGIGSPRIILD